MNPAFSLDYFWPILGAVAAGAIIGFEREFRGSPAGLRTHMLVALSSALLMLAAVHQIEWLDNTPHALIRIDPVRMAHGVLTGIGFLGAGVIFRQGANIRGLTTAASLWITAALGMLFGVGFYSLAIGGTLATVAVLGAVTLSDRLIPQLRYVDLEVRFNSKGAPAVEAMVARLRGYGLKAEPFEHQRASGETIRKFRLRYGRESKLEALAEDLGQDSAVTSFSIVHAMR